MKKKIVMVMSAILLATSNMSLPFSNQQVTVNAAVKVSQQEDATTGVVDMGKLLDMNELYGWADVPGNGLMTTTGGGNTTPVVVTNTEEFYLAVTDDLPRVVVVSGEVISMSSGVKEQGGYAINIGSNKTIVGIDSNATLYGGINIKAKSNVIVSNLNIHGTWPSTGPDDTINIENSHHVWINHLNIWNSSDGSIDSKMGADYITVSWCKLWYEDAIDVRTGTLHYAKDHDHRLACLIGSGAGDHDDTDMGKLHVTYHHNWFADYVDQRMPRVMYGRAHVYNNYYTCQDNTYCIGADSYASVLIENNYFKNVNNPHEFSYTPGLPASIVARGNEYDNTTGSKTTGQHYDTTKITPFETTVYDYTLSDAVDIPEIVKNYAGPRNMADTSIVPEALKNATLVKGVEDNEEVLPSVEPLPTLTPTNTLNDNPITYDETTKTYTYHGQNSNNSNAYFTIDNPFKGYDFSEPFTFLDGHPVWTKGATISYWVKVPEDAVDAAVLNFNLENDRQIQRDDAVKYRMCKAYSALDQSYSMGSTKTYVDATGNEYTVLFGHGENVQYNPNYPAAGCYEATFEGGAISAKEKGAGEDAESLYLNFIGEGYYQNYGVRFDEPGGSKSLIREAKISGSLSLYASGTMGFRQDNWHGLQMNPYLLSYGQVLDAYQYNQHYYWGNGGYKNLKDSGAESYTPTMKEKDKWHFVVVVIQNDWIQYYMDGEEMTIDYLNWWNKYIDINAGSKGFNYGYGMKLVYRQNPSSSHLGSMSILEMLSDEDTVLTVGGLGAGATRLGQENIGTPNGTQVKDFQFYYTPIEAKYILADKIQTEEEPQPDFKYGDVDDNGVIELIDAQLALKAALRIENLDTKGQKAADVVVNDEVTLEDALSILRCSLHIITEEEMVQMQPVVAP